MLPVVLACACRLLRMSHATVMPPMTTAPASATHSTVTRPRSSARNRRHTLRDPRLLELIFIDCPFIANLFVSDTASVNRTVVAVEQQWVATQYSWNLVYHLVIQKRLGDNARAWQPIRVPLPVSGRFITNALR